MSLFPLAQLPQVHPVAAADYFLRNRWLAWFALNIIGIIPLERTSHRSGTEALQAIYSALDQGQILILFPEGTRGEPERMSKFKNGIARLAQTRPEVPVIPIFLHGLGKSLPKGEILLVPFFCDIFIGDALPWTGDKASYMQSLDDTMRNLANEGQLASWE
jgi:1-acyl-sn-glycerol-3-phosphate acyltransferase